MARPAKFKDEYIEQAYVACVEGGFTDLKLAKLFGVSKSTINNWKHEYPEFLDSIKGGKDKFNVLIAEKSLIKRVKGCLVTETTRQKNKQGELVVTKKVKKRILPDPTSLIFFLKNRDPERWRDGKHVEHGGSVKHTHDVSDELKEKLDEIYKQKTGS